jgi:hypothetical protein
MKKLLPLGVLYFAFVGAASAQYTPPNAPGDIVVPGSNAWLLHTPDDGRTTMYVTPWNGSDWNWGAATEYSNNGDVLFRGRVKIGTRNPTSVAGYKLAVDGSIAAQAIYVTSPSVWADFVFEPDYKPMSLPSLESYLRRNKHLPYIPSAKQVETQGYDVTGMDAKLLQSLEELTLHVIELGKQNEQLQAEVAKLRAQTVKKLTRKK